MFTDKTSDQHLEKLPKQTFHTANCLSEPKTQMGMLHLIENIFLHWCLVRAPKFVIDYDIVHELVHTRVMNGSVKFKTLCARSFVRFVFLS